MVQICNTMIKRYSLKFLISLLLLQGFSMITKGQPLSVKYTKQLGGTGSVRVLGTTTDVNGDILLCGIFTGTADFDPGLAQLTKTVTGGANSDIFIQKLDANGNLIWINTIGTNLTEYAEDLTVDGSGNIYITGKFSGTMDFNPGTGTFNLTAPGSSEAAYILKLDENGLFKWARAFLISGTGFAYGIDIVADSENSPVILGYYKGTLDMDPTPGSDIVTTKGWQDPFIVKLDSNGMYKWGKTYGGTGHDYTTALAIDKNQNLYSCGYFENTVDFDPGSGTHNLTTSGSLNDRAFIQKLRANGDFDWVVAPSGGSTEAYTIAISDDGSLYSGGVFYGTTDLNPGTGSYQVTSKGAMDLYVHKLDTSGSFQWAYTAGSKNLEYMSEVTFDRKGNVYVTGSFTDTTDFDPGTGTDIRIPKGKNDAYLVGINANGSYGWVASYGSIDFDKGERVIVDPAGDLLITGYFSDTVDFNPGSSSNLMVSQGASDTYIVKYNDPTSGITEFNSSADIGSIYPNPTSGIINIRLNVSGGANVRVFNTSGQVVFHKQILQNTLQLNLPENSGLYLVELQAQNGFQRFKVIRQ